MTFEEAVEKSFEEHREGSPRLVYYDLSNGDTVWLHILSNSRKSEWQATIHFDLETGEYSGHMMYPSGKITRFADDIKRYLTE